MAKIIERLSQKKVDTLCEHMSRKGANRDFFSHVFVYCPECGQKLHHFEPTTCKACSSCDGAIHLEIPNLKHCPWCGEKFDD